MISKSFVYFSLALLIASSTAYAMDKSVVQYQPPTDRTYSTQEDNFGNWVLNGNDKNVAIALACAEEPEAFELLNGSYGDKPGHNDATPNADLITTFIVHSIESVKQAKTNKSWLGALQEEDKKKLESIQDMATILFNINPQTKKPIITNKEYPLAALTASGKRTVNKVKPKDCTSMTCVKTVSETPIAIVTNALLECTDLKNQPENVLIFLSATMQASLETQFRGANQAPEIFKTKILQPNT